MEVKRNKLLSSSIFIKIATPLICLLLVLLIQKVAESNISPDYQKSYSFPVPLNVPYSS